MRIALAQTPDEIAACHPVMKELRMKYPLRAFVQQVREQQADGYLLAFVEDEGEMSAEASFSPLHQRP